MANADIIVDKTIPVLGIALFSALILGKTAKRVHIPKVSAFMLTGIVLGPTVFNLMNHQILQELTYLKEVAFGLILFNIGGAFNKDLFSKLDKKFVAFNFAFIHIVLLIVFLVILASSLLFSPFSLVQSLVIATLLALISIESAPPTTLLVLKEYNSSGAVSQSIMIYLAMGTCMAIIGVNAFEATMETLNVWAPLHSGHIPRILTFLWSTVGSIALGIGLGLLLALWERKEINWGDTLFVVVSFILLGESLCFYLRMDPLLFSLFLGLSVANSSTVGEKIHSNLKDMGLSIYALFFVMAGSHIHLQQIFKTLGVTALAYIVARSLALMIGPRITAHFFKLPENFAKVKGNCLLSHAGAALAIASKLEPRVDPAVQSVVYTVMTSIFIFEIAGPLLLKKSLLSIGEISAGSSEKDQISKVSKSSREVFITLLRNLGFIKSQKIEKWLQIKDLIKSDVLTIKANAGIKDVLTFIKDETQIYPVIDEMNVFLGVLSIDSVKKVVAEETPFIRAIDLIGEAAAISSDTTIYEASEVFSNTKLEKIPVIDYRNRRFLGVLLHKDVVLELEKRKETAKGKGLIIP